MKSDKIRTFMQLGGQTVGNGFREGSDADRRLGARLLLSEVLEYVIHGLGVIPEVNGQKITDPESVVYHAEAKPDQLAMLDGLADVAYTMYWNSEAFGLRLEEAFELVCDNNLGKFVKLEGWKRGECVLTRDEWDCGKGIVWPPEVHSVSIITVKGGFYAVGKDAQGKVRKPSTYKQVALEPLLG